MKLALFQSSRNRFVRKAAMVIVLASSLLYWTAPNVSAHTIDVAKAREKAREYARAKVNDPNRNYKHYQTDCVAAFPNHNHIVTCSIGYDTEANRGNKEFSCKESIEVYLYPHKDFLVYTLQIRHTSKAEC